MPWFHRQRRKSGMVRGEICRTVQQLEVGNKEYVEVICDAHFLEGGGTGRVGNKAPPPFDRRNVFQHENRTLNTRQLRIPKTTRTVE